MASVQDSGAAGRDVESPQIFKDMKFFLAARVPCRSGYRSDIERLGGIVVGTEDDDVITIVDHLKTKTATRPNTLSYKYVDECRVEGCLLDQADYRIRVPKTSGFISSGVSGDVRRSKLPYTVEEDCFLWDRVNEAIKRGAKVAGNKLFEEIATERPRHTLQSWRDHWLKKIQGKPRPLPLVEEEVASNSEADEQAQTYTSNEIDKAMPSIVASPDDQLEMLVEIAPGLDGIDPEDEERLWQSLSERPGMEHHTPQEWKQIWLEIVKPKFQKMSSQIRSTPRKGHRDDEIEAYAPDSPIGPLRKQEQNPGLQNQQKAPIAGLKRQRLLDEAGSGQDDISGQSPRKRARRHNESDETMREEVENTILAGDTRLFPEVEIAETTEAINHTEAIDTRLPGVQDGETSDSDDLNEEPPDIDEILSSSSRTRESVDRFMNFDHVVEVGDEKEVSGAVSEDYELHEDAPEGVQEEDETQSGQTFEAEFTDMPTFFGDLTGQARLENEAHSASGDDGHAMEGRGEELQSIPKVADVAERMVSSTHGEYEGEEDDMSEPDIDDLAAVDDGSFENTFPVDETTDLMGDDTYVVDDGDDDDNDEDDNDDDDADEEGDKSEAEAEAETEAEVDAVHAVLPRDTQAIFKEDLPEFDLDMPELDVEGGDAISDQLMREMLPTSSIITTTTPGNTASQTQVSSAPSRQRYSSVDDGSYIQTTQPGMTPRELDNSDRAEAPAQLSDAEPDSEADPTDDDGLPGWVAEKQREGYGRRQIGHALRASCLQLDVADVALRFMQAKNRLPDNLRGLWTEKDDRDLHSSDARKIKRVQEKHGDHNLQVREEFLSEENEDS